MKPDAGAAARITLWLKRAPIDDVRAWVQQLDDVAARARVRQQVLHVFALTGAPPNDAFVQRLQHSVDDWLELLARCGRLTLPWALLKSVQR